MKYSWFRLFFVLGLAILCLVTSVSALDSFPAGSPEITSDIPLGKSVLRFGIHTSRIGNFDPDYAKASEDYIVEDMVFNSLLLYVSGDSSQLEPDIAIKMPEFEIQNNKQIWPIHLRKGIFFHGGSYTKPYELTAKDVIYSLEKAADPLRSEKFGKYAGMKFEMLDAYALEIIVEKPMSPLFFSPLIANRQGGFIA